jgi:hypothetical protein
MFSARLVGCSGEVGKAKVGKAVSSDRDNIEIKQDQSMDDKGRGGLGLRQIPAFRA